MKQKIIPILILSLVTIAIFVYIFFPEIFSKEKPPQKPPEDNIDNIDNKIRKTIDSLSEKDWDKKYYYDTKSYIEAFYHKKGKDGTSEEDIALDELDLVYMKVLNKAMDIVIDNFDDDCFDENDTLRSEVNSFYSQYKSESNEIRKANSWFDTERKIKQLKGKVRTLLSKRKDDNSYKKLKNRIKTLKMSNNYSKMKRCGTLSSIIRKAEKDLNDFSNVEYTYNKEFKNDLKEYRDKWESLGKVDDYWINHFGDKNYKWYHNQVQKVNQTLKDRKSIVNQIEEMDSKNLLDMVLQKRQDHNNSLNKLNKKLEELEKKLDKLINEK